MNFYLVRRRKEIDSENKFGLLTFKTKKRSTNEKLAVYRDISVALASSGRTEHPFQGMYKGQGGEKKR